MMSENTLMKVIFYSEQVVMVAPDAFPGSMERRDVKARGSKVTLKYVIDETPNEAGSIDTLWEAKLSTGESIFPLESELLVI